VAVRQLDQRKRSPDFSRWKVVVHVDPAIRPMFSLNTCRAPRFGVDEIQLQRIWRRFQTAPTGPIADPAKRECDVGIAGEGNPFGLPPLAAITPQPHHWFGRLLWILFLIQLGCVGSQS